MSPKIDRGVGNGPQSRVPRGATILSQAEQTFANKAKADAWLRRPTSALGGRRPIDLLDSETGCRLVEQLLYRIGHGIASWRCACTRREASGPEPRFRPSLSVGEHRCGSTIEGGDRAS
ncbi:MAG: antitoxin Xre/MbcA/ParS toxin-binding domain-containing protein [Geminicoccaceae bacterium]